jgi:thymidylate synthase
MGDEGLELLGTCVQFHPGTGRDEILDRLADQQMIAEMKKVFFHEGTNALGHSYAKVVRGPEGRNDLQDVIALLRSEPLTKRALVTLSSQPGGKVPCVNAVQFLVRDSTVQTMYFARGQDAYRKFYADALCLASMAEAVAAALGLATGTVRGFIGSSHIYHKDTASIRETLLAAKTYLPTQREQGALA